MWLASRLCEKQIITPAQLAKAAELQLSRRPSLGALAIQHGLMSVEQVMDVSSVQADELDRPFGELAVEMAFLTRQQLAEVMFDQAEQCPSLGELLVEMGALSAEELRREVQEARILANLSEEISRELCV